MSSIDITVNADEVKVNKSNKTCICGYKDEDNNFYMFAHNSIESCIKYLVHRIEELTVCVDQLKSKKGLR